MELDHPHVNARLPLPQKDTPQSTRSDELGMTGRDVSGSQLVPISPTADDGATPINAMGAICTMPLPSEGERESIYGQSSIISLMNHIPRPGSDVDPSLGAGSVPKPVGPSPQTRNLSPRASWKRFSRFSLPPRKDADFLVDQFWRNVHLFYPWIHFPSFLKAYDQVWAEDVAQMDNQELPRVGLGGRGCSETLFHCALNTIFALGCEFCDSAHQESEIAGQDFLEKANELLQASILDEEGLALVQTLLLLTVYLQSTQYTMRCWGVAGLAYRMAHGIGLHLNYTTSKRTVLEMELRRRAWHGCLFMDRIVSMALGRLPNPVESGVVPYFSSVDDEYLDVSCQTCEQPENIIPRVAFAIENCKVAEILGDVLRQLYNHQVSHEGTDSLAGPAGVANLSLDAIASLEDSLSQFENALPAMLNWQAPRLADHEIPRPVLRQRRVLQVRFLHVQLMLHRPFLTDVRGRPTAKGVESKDKRQLATPIPQLSENGRDAMRTMFAKRCATSCYKTAGEIIEVLHRAVFEDLYGAWWYALFYLMAAGMVLIVAENSHELRSEIDQNRLTKQWRLAFELLDLIKVRHRMAGQCANALQEIRDRAVAAYRNSHDSGSDTAKAKNDDSQVAPQAQNTLAGTSTTAEDPSILGLPGVRESQMGQMGSMFLEGGDLEDIFNNDGIFTPMLQEMPGAFNGSFPGALWHGLDQDLLPSISMF